MFSSTEKEPKFLDLVANLMKIPFHLLLSSRNRAIGVALANTILHFTEVVICIGRILNDVNQSFLDTPLDCLLGFFSLKVLPAVLGLALTLSILTNHEIMSHGWCLLEILAVFVSIALFSSSDPNEMDENNNTTGFIVYIFLKIVGVLFVYHYLYDLKSGKFDKDYCFDSGFDSNKLSVSYDDFLNRPLPSFENLDANNELKYPDFDVIIVHKYSIRP